MAYQEHGMWEVRDVLRRVQRKESRRQIARATGRSRKTVGRYVSLAVQLGWDKACEPSEELASRVAAGLRPGPKSSLGAGDKILVPFRSDIEAWLAPHDGYKRGLTLTKIHEKLKRQGADVSYSALHRFVRRHFDFGRGSSTVRMADVAPGQLAEVDFGRLGAVFK